MSTFSVIIATYGDHEWEVLAKERALPSVEDQSFPPAEIIMVHGDNLAEARNEGAEQAKGRHLIFLDADDELDHFYISEMTKANYRSDALLNPAVQFILPEGPQPVKMFRRKPLRHGNYLIIGTAMPRYLFFEAGGFDPQWSAYEDWSLFMRLLYLRGYVIPVPRAIYKAHWNSEGRNNTIPDAEGLKKRIIADYDAWEAARR